MLRSFLFIFLMLMSSLAFTQTLPKKKVSTKNPVQVAPEIKVIEEPQKPVETKAPELRTSLGGRISQNLRIGYYGALTGPAFDHMDDHQINFDGTRSSDPVNLWNQISFNYNFGLKLNFIFNPRFTTQLGSTHSVHKDDPDADSGFYVREDFLTGFQGVIASAGKFTYWSRLAVRVPTSSASQRAHILAQPEVFNDFNVAINPQFQFGLWQQVRLWKFETLADQKDKRLWRLYHAPYVYFSISDFLRIDAYYNHGLDHKGGKDTWHLNRSEELTNYQIGPTFNFTPNFNIYLYAQVWDKIVDIETAQIGAWISVSDI